MLEAVLRGHERFHTRVFEVDRIKHLYLSSRIIVDGMLAAGLNNVKMRLFISLCKFPASLMN